MAGQKLSEESILAFRDNLILEEKSTCTTEKYLRDVCAFFRFAGEKPVTKELVMDYKKALVGAGESWSHSFCVYLESDLRNKKEKKTTPDKNCESFTEID